MTRHESNPLFAMGGRTLGPALRPYLIAEIGVNHNGDLELARRSIREAASAGADAVKFQTFRAEEFMADKDMDFTYESADTVVSESMFAMFKRLELPRKWHFELKEEADALGVDFLSSCADPLSAELLVELGCEALKLSSEDIINTVLLERIAQLGVPVIQSTGMADEEEIAVALEIYSKRQLPVLLLHCVSTYPTPDDEAHVRRISALQQRFGRPVGYSDHTRGVDAGMAAVALGAVCVEKHFTVDRDLPGPDHRFSADPQELAALRRGIDRVWTMLGDASLDPSASELGGRLQFRRSIVAARDLPAGTLLAPGDLALKRPGTGLHPHRLASLLGRRLKTDVAKDQQLTEQGLK